MVLPSGVEQNSLRGSRLLHSIESSEGLPLRRAPSSERGGTTPVLIGVVFDRRCRGCPRKTRNGDRPSSGGISYRQLVGLIPDLLKAEDVGVGGRDGCCNRMYGYRSASYRMKAPGHGDVEGVDRDVYRIAGFAAVNRCQPQPATSDENGENDQATHHVQLPGFSVRDDARVVRLAAKMRAGKPPTSTRARSSGVGFEARLYLGSRMATPTPTRITDWDSPRLPLLLRLFNAVSGWPTRTFVSLEPEDLLSAASRQTGLSDFGDDRFREPLGDSCIRAVQSETELSPFGRIAARQLVLQLLRSRLRLEELYRLHPEIEDVEIDRPIIVCGLPRTGTTHLLNLLSQDPSFRWLPVLGKPRAISRSRRTPRARMGVIPASRDVPERSTASTKSSLSSTRCTSSPSRGRTKRFSFLRSTFRRCSSKAAITCLATATGTSARIRRPTYAYLKRCMKALQFLRPR